MGKVKVGKLSGLDLQVSNMSAGVRAMAKSLVLRVGKERLSVSEIEKLLTAMENLQKAVRDLHLQLHAAKVARDAEIPTMRAFLMDLKVAVVAHFGRESGALNAFGIKPYEKRARRSKKASSSSDAPRTN